MKTQLFQAQERPSQARARLLAESRTDPQRTRTSKPCKLFLNEIAEEPLVFQPKSSMDDDLIRSIAGGVRGSEDFDEAVDVWWSGARWIVIDGHHRLAGYRIKEVKSGERQVVPIRCLVGATLEEAEARSRLLNSRDRRAMSREERMDAAWRFVCTGNGSASEQATWANVSKRQIALMRGVFGRLRDRRKSPGALVNMGWDAARRADQGGKRGEFNPAQAEAMAAEWSKKIIKALPVELLLKHSDVFSRAIEMASGELPGMMIESTAFWGALDGPGRALLEERDREALGRDALENEGLPEAF